MKRKLGSLFFALALSFGMTACSIPTPGGNNNDKVEMAMTEEEAMAKLKQLGLDQGFEIKIETKDEEGVVGNMTLGYKEDVFWLDDNALKKVDGKVEVYDLVEGVYVYQESVEDKGYFDNIINTYIGVLYTAYQFADLYSSSKSTTFLGRPATEYTYKATVLTASAEWKYIVDNETGITLAFSAKATAEGETGTATYEVKSIKIGNQVTVPTLVKNGGQDNPPGPGPDIPVDPTIALKFTKAQAQNNILALAERGILMTVEGMDDGEMVQKSMGYKDDVLWTPDYAFKQNGDMLEMYNYDAENGYVFYVETEMAGGVQLTFVSAIEEFLSIYEFAGSFVSVEEAVYYNLNEPTNVYVVLDSDGSQYKYIVSDVTGMVCAVYALDANGREQLIMQIVNMVTGDGVRVPTLIRNGGQTTPDHPANYTDYAIRIIRNGEELDPIPMALVDGKTDEYCALAVPLKADDLFEIHMAGDDWRSIESLKISQFSGDNFDQIPSLGNFIRSKNSQYVDIYVGVNADVEGTYAGKSIWIQAADGQGQGGDPVVTPDYVIHHGKPGFEWSDVQMSLFEDGKQYIAKNVELETGECFVIHMAGDDWRGVSDLKDTDLMNHCFTSYAPDSNDVRVVISGTYDFYIMIDKTEGKTIYAEFSDEQGGGQQVQTPDYVIHRGREGEAWTNVQMALTEGQDEYYIQGIEFQAGDCFAIHMSGDDWRGYQNLKDSEFIKNNFGLKSEGDKAIVVKNAGSYDIYVTIAQNGGKSIWIEAHGGQQQQNDYWPEEEIAAALLRCEISGVVPEPTTSASMTQMASVAVPGDGTLEVVITMTYKDAATAYSASGSYLLQLFGEECGFEPVLGQTGNDAFISMFKGEMQIDVYSVSYDEETGKGPNYFSIVVKTYADAGYPSEAIAAFLEANEYYALPSLENTSVASFQFVVNEEFDGYATLVMKCAEDESVEEVIAEQQSLILNEGYLRGYHVEGDYLFDVLIAPDFSSMLVWNSFEDGVYFSISIGSTDGYFTPEYPTAAIEDYAVEGITEEVPELSIGTCVYEFVPEDAGYAIGISMQDEMTVEAVMSDLAGQLKNVLEYQTEDDTTFVSPEGQITITLESYEDKIVYIHFAFEGMETEQIEYSLFDYETWLLNDDAAIYAWVWGGNYGEGQWVRCDTYTGDDGEGTPVVFIYLSVDDSATGCILVRFNPVVENDFEDLNTVGNAFINDENENYARMSRYVWNKMGYDIDLDPDYSEYYIEIHFND